DIDNTLHSNLSLAYLLSFTVPYPMLATEYIQLKHKGFRRYANVYSYLNSNGVPLRNYTVATSLTTLVMWIELLLLLRFFSGPANYINISLSIIRRSSYVKIDNVADSYFSNFWGAIMTVYFWINGRWDQVRSMTVASILLITVMQNMLVAFMTSVFDDARASGRQAVLKFRAELIYEYETLEKA
ncbi:20409_t:CDS:2, partial [Rhizophagus irregularis]